MAWRIVIAGGGFGGLYAARELERILPARAARITLVNDVNFMLYTPLLPGAAAGTLEPRHVVVPLREELERTDLRLGRVTGAEPERNRLMVDTLEGHHEAIEYDHLIVALGSVSRTLPIPGLAQHAIGFKTLSEAIALRNRVILSLEMAETLEDPEARAAYLSFVFVGGGYSGVEGLAELQDFAADIIERYPRCRLQGMRWMLVEAARRPMTEVPPDLSDFTMRELRRRGIELRLGQTLEQVTDRSATLSTGEVVPTRTVVWTAGVKPHPVVQRLGLPLALEGRIESDRFMRVPGHENVWAIGDAAAVPDPARKGEPCPPTAQHALRQGRRVAQNVAAAIGRGRRRPFRYRTLGVFVDLGRHQAVAQTLFLRWRGFPAWFLARTYHMALMPGVKRRLRLLVDWTIGLLFDRDASELGQLGHPPRLDLEAPEPLGEKSAGGTPAPEPRPEAARTGGRPHRRLTAGRRAYPGDVTEIAERVRADITVAMKAGERKRTGALRLVLSELQKAAKEGGADEVAVLRRERKRRLEAAGQYRDNDRADLAEGEEREAELIAGYLPAEIEDPELETIVREAVAETGATEAKDMGRVMSVVMSKVGGRADGKRVSAKVREALQS
jgi:NADH:quinone reductase (non-electrogenic)